MRPEIEAYLREHGASYTTDALRGQLIAAGHDPAEVDTALREAQAALIPEPARTSGVTVVAWALFLIGAVVGAFGALLVASLAGVGGGRQNVPLFIAMYAVAYLGIGYLVVRVVRSAGTAFEIHGLPAVLLGLALVPVFGALVFGTCVAAANLATAPGG